MSRVVFFLFLLFCFVAGGVGVRYLNALALTKVFPRFGPPHYRLFLNTGWRGLDTDGGTKLWKAQGFADSEIDLIQRRQFLASIEFFAVFLLIFLFSGVIWDHLFESVG